jgi:hypothetical protein
MGFLWILCLSGSMNANSQPFLSENVCYTHDIEVSLWLWDFSSELYKTLLNLQLERGGPKWSLLASFWNDPKNIKQKAFFRPLTCRFKGLRKTRSLRSIFPGKVAGKQSKKAQKRWTFASRQYIRVERQKTTTDPLIRNPRTFFILIYKGVCGRSFEFFSQFSITTSLGICRHVTKRVKLPGQVGHIEATWSARPYPDEQFNLLTGHIEATWSARPHPDEQFHLLTTRPRRSSLNFRSLHDVAVRPPAVRATLMYIHYNGCIRKHLLHGFTRNLPSRQLTWLAFKATLRFCWSYLLLNFVLWEMLLGNIIRPDLHRDRSKLKWNLLTCLFR